MGQDSQVMGQDSQLMGQDSGQSVDGDKTVSCWDRAVS